MLYIVLAYLMLFAACTVLLLCLFFLILCSHRCCFCFLCERAMSSPDKIALKNNHYYYVSNIAQTCYFELCRLAYIHRFLIVNNWLVSYIYIGAISSLRMWHLAVVTRLERVEDDSDYTKNVQRYWKGAVRDSRRRPCPTKPFQLALGQRGKVWPTPSYHESHRKTNTGRSCWVSGFKSRPNRIAYG